MFKFRKRKSVVSEFTKPEEGVIKAAASLDLRNYTPESLRNIKGIKAVAVVLLPENASDEFNEAYNAIPKMAVAAEVRAAADAKVESYNGKTVINAQTVSDNSICLINGVAVIMDIGDMKCKAMINGELYIQKGSNVEILTSNGKVHILDFKAVKSFTSIDINSDFIKASETGTLIIANNISIDSSVTNEMLIESGMLFAANEIICPESVYGTVANKALADSIKRK
mgnify:CR=1 FL=1